ncbi:MAG TPA: dephospho-CoA kinase [Tenuifilaceae bacterium]|nr:dephospho-CoA kinase [Tenuifilaceae bacterium]
MIVVGITGGIGSGKSMVSSILKAMGYAVYNADIEARAIMNTNQMVVEDIKQLFGDDVYEKGTLNRPRVAELVFDNPTLLANLNSIVHPAVANHFDEWKRLHANAKILFKEAAILFESGAYKQVDFVIAITAPQELKIERVCKRDGISRNQVMQRMGNQLPDKELVDKSDFIIVNDEVKLLVPQVIEIVNKLLQRDN